MNYPLKTGLLERPKVAKDMTSSITEPQVSVRWSVPNQCRWQGTASDRKPTTACAPSFLYFKVVDLENIPNRALYSLFLASFFELGNHDLNHVRILPKGRVSALGTLYSDFQRTNNKHIIYIGERLLNTIEKGLRRIYLRQNNNG